MGTQPPPQKGAEPPYPIFGPFLLRPNGWMHQDATWYGGRPQPRKLCYMGTTPVPKKGAEPPPQFRSMSIVAKRLYGARCIWCGGRPRPMRHCVRWGRSSPLKGAQPPVFSSYVFWPNGWMDEVAIWYGSRPRPRPHCIRRGTVRL